MTPCIQEKTIITIWEKLDAHHKEIYEGREGRPSLNVRLDRVERVVEKLVYVSTAIMVAVVIGAGTMVFRIVLANS
jgi:hypothetical protein